MIEVQSWLAGLAALPVLVVAASYSNLHVERLRVVATMASALMTVIAALALVTPELQGFRWPAGTATTSFWRASWLRVDAFSAALHVIPPGLWLLAVAVTPKLRLDRTGLRRTALATLTTTAAFLTENPLVLVVLWILSLAIFRAALGAPEHRHARRVVTAYLAAATALFGAGLGLLALSNGSGRLQYLGLALLVLAVLIRKGIFPFHAWIPEVFEGGRLGPAILFCAPQLGSYTAVVLIVPHAAADTLRLVSLLALVTAVYGAALALVQKDPRRSCGYLFVSQSALVMAGLDCTSREALAGSLVLWLSSSLAFAVLTRCVLVLEARRGRLDLNRFHGGYARMPMLAATFLLTGLACTGFPGTLGFVGEEMLLNGAVGTYPVLGFLVVIAGALTGMAILRMYFSLFCGSPPPGTVQRLLRREALTFAAVALVLVGTGLAPGPVVATRLVAGEAVMAQRAVAQASSSRGTGGPSTEP